MFNVAEPVIFPPLLLMISHIQQSAILLFLGQLEGSATSGHEYLNKCMREDSLHLSLLLLKSNMFVYQQLMVYIFDLF